MTIFVVLGILLVGPSMNLWGIIGIVPPMTLCAIGAIASVVIERLKRQNNIQTYSEIVSFIEGTPLDEGRNALEKKHLALTRFLLALAAAAIAAIFGIVSLTVFS